MTYEEWRATRKIGLGEYGDDILSGYEYEGGHIAFTPTTDWLRRGMPRYRLMIQCDEWYSDSLEDLEAILWREWIVGELELGG